MLKMTHLKYNNRKPGDLETFNMLYLLWRYVIKDTPEDIILLLANTVAL